MSSTRGKSRIGFEGQLGMVRGFWPSDTTLVVLQACWRLRSVLDFLLYVIGYLCRIFGFMTSDLYAIPKTSFKFKSIVTHANSLFRRGRFPPAFALKA